MCARLTSYQPAKEEFVDVNSSSASYRVLRNGRQQPWRSVDRESAGRNASEAIELRHIFRMWVPSFYCYGEGNTQTPRGKGPTGVRVHSMLTRLVERTEEVQIQVETEDEVTIQEFILKKLHTPNLDVRWLNSSWEIG